MSCVGCLICFQAFSETRQSLITPCGHLYDEECIQDWLTRSSTCPSCRAYCSGQQLRKVFFSSVPADEKGGDPDSELREAIANSKLEELNNILEAMRIEKETLIDDNNVQKQKILELEKILK